MTITGFNEKPLRKCASLDRVKRYCYPTVFLTVCKGAMWIKSNVQKLFKSRGSKYFAACIPPVLENAERDALLQQALAQASFYHEEEARRNNTIVPETENERVTPWMVGHACGERHG